MKKCPACSKIVDDAATECPHCSIIFSKWESRQASPPPPPPEQGSPAPRGGFPFLYVIMGIIVLAGGLWFTVKPGKKAAPAGTIQQSVEQEEQLPYQPPPPPPPQQEPSFNYNDTSAPPPPPEPAPGQPKGVENFNPHNLDIWSLDDYTDDQLKESLPHNPSFAMRIAKMLVSRGQRDNTIQILNGMLRDKSGDYMSPPSSIEHALQQCGGSKTYDWRRDRESYVEADDVKIAEWSAEISGNSIYTSGVIKVGRDIIHGQAKRQSGTVTLTPYCKYTIKCQGSTGGYIAEKEYDITGTDTYWNNQLLVSGISTGKYTISAYISTQYVDGTGQARNLFNSSNGVLTLDMR